MILVRVLVISTFLIICALISYIDIQKQTIYNEAVAALFVPAIVSFFVFSEISMVSRLLGAVSVSGLMLVISLLRPGAFGGGDIKLMVPVGLFLGLDRTLAAGIFAVFIGGIWGAVVLVRGRGRLCGRTSPFGPALCLGSVLALLAVR